MKAKKASSTLQHVPHQLETQNVLLRMMIIVSIIMMMNCIFIDRQDNIGGGLVNASMIGNVFWKLDLDGDQMIWKQINYRNGKVERRTLGNDTLSNGNHKTYKLLSSVNAKSDFTSIIFNLNFTNDGSDFKIISNSYLVVEWKNSKIYLSALDDLLNNWMSLESTSDGSSQQYVEFSFTKSSADLILNGNVNSLAATFSTTDSFLNFISNTSMLYLESNTNQLPSLSVYITTNKYSWTCFDLTPDDPQVCSGMGVCTEPDTCNCHDDLNGYYLAPNCSVITTQQEVTFANSNGVIMYSTVSSNGQQVGHCLLGKDGNCYDPATAENLGYNQEVLSDASLTTGPICSSVTDFMYDSRCQLESFRKGKTTDSSPGNVIEVGDSTFSIGIDVIKKYKGEPVSYDVVDPQSGMTISCVQTLLAKGVEQGSLTMQFFDPGTADASFCWVNNPIVHNILHDDFTFQFYFLANQVGANMTLFDFPGRFEIYISSDMQITVDMTPMTEPGKTAILVADTIIKVNYYYGVTLTKNIQGEVKIYVNGYPLAVKVIKTKIEISSASVTYIIGRKSNGGSKFIGSIDKIQVNQRSIGGPEIKNGVGSQDSTFCFGINSLDITVCNGHGSCAKNDTCSCDSDYRGNNCETPLTCFGKYLNDSSICSGHGSCTDIDTCVCSLNWKQPDCSEKKKIEESYCAPKGLYPVYIAGIEQKYNSNYQLTLEIKQLSVCGFLLSYKKVPITQFIIKNFTSLGVSLQSIQDKLISTQAMKDGNLTISIDPSFLTEDQNTDNVITVSPVGEITSRKLRVPSKISSSGSSRTLSNGKSYYTFSLNDLVLTIYEFETDYSSTSTLIYTYEDDFTPDQLRYATPIVRDDGTMSVYLPVIETNPTTNKQTIRRIRISSTGSYISSFQVDNDPSSIPYFFLFDGFDENIVTLNTMGTSVYSISNIESSNDTISSSTNSSTIQHTPIQLSLKYSNDKMILKPSTRVFKTNSAIVVAQDESTLFIPSSTEDVPFNIPTIKPFALPEVKPLFFDDAVYISYFNSTSYVFGNDSSVVGGNNSTTSNSSLSSNSTGNGSNSTNSTTLNGTSLNTTQASNQTISGNETIIGNSSTNSNSSLSSNSTGIEANSTLPPVNGTSLNTTQTIGNETNISSSVVNNSTISNSTQSLNSTVIGSNSTLPLNGTGTSPNSTQTINQGNETSIGNNSLLSNGTSWNENVNGSLIVNTTSNSSSISTNNSSDILNTTMNSNSTNGSLSDVNSTQTSNTTIVINATDTNNNTSSQVSSNTTISNNGSSDDTNSSQILNGTIIISNNSSSYNNSKLLNSTSSAESFNSTSDSLSSSNSTQNYNSSNGSNNTMSSQNGQTNSTISSNTTGINNTSIGMSESQNETLSQNGTISNNTDNGTNNITNYEAVGGNNSTTNGSLISGLNNTVSSGGNANNSQINGNLTNSNNTLAGSNNATMNNITQNSTNNSSDISSNSTLGIFNSSFTNQSSVSSNSTNGNMMNNSSLVNNSSNVVNSTNYGSNNNSTNNGSTNSSSNSTNTNNNNGSIGNSTIGSSNSSSTQNNNSSISNGNTTIGNSDTVMNGTTSNSNNTSQFNDTTSNTDKVDNSTIGQVLNSTTFTDNSTANINSTIGEHSSDSNSTLNQEGVSNNKTSYSNSTTNSSNNGTIQNSESNNTLSSNNSTMNSGNNSTDTISNSDNTNSTIDNSTIISTNSSQVTAADNSTISNSTESSSVENSNNSTSSNLTTIDSNHSLQNATNNSTISSLNNSTISNITTSNNSNKTFNSSVTNSTTSSNINSTVPPSSDHEKNPPSPIDNPPISVYIPKVYCFGVEQSSNLSCFGNGKCLSNDSCVCDENYIGSNCSIAVCFGIAGSNSSVCEGNGKCIEANTCKCNDGFTGQQCQYQTVTQLCTGSFVPAEQITVSDSNVYLQKSLMDTVCGKSLILQSTTLLEDIPSSVNNSNLLKYYTMTTDINVESGDKYLTFDTMLYKSKIPNSLIIWKIDKFSNATQMVIPISNVQQENATYGLVKILDNPNGDLLGITLKDNSTNVTILEIDTSNKEANISSVFDKGPITFTDIDKGNQVFNPSTNTTTFTFFKEGTSNSSLLLSVNLETPTETPKEVVIPQTTQKYFTLVLYDHPDQYLLSSDQQTTTISTIVPDIDSSKPEFNQLASDSNFVVAKNDLVVLTKDTEKITVTNVNSDVSLIIALSQLTPDPSVFDQSTQLTKFQPITYINNVQSEATVLSIRRIYPLYVPVTGTIPIYLEGNYVLPGTRPYLILKYDPMDLVVARLPIQTQGSKSFVTSKDISSSLPQELSLMDTFKVSVQIQLISETSDPIPISTNTELTIYRFELLKVLPRQAFYGDKILAMASFFPPTNNVNLFILPQSATEEIQVPCTVLNSTFCSATLPFLSGSSDTVLNIRASLVQDGVSSKYDNKLFVRYVDPSVVKVTSLDNFDTSISPSEDIPDQDSTPPIIQRQEVAETVQPPLIIKMNIAKLNKSKCTDKPIRQVIASSDLHDISNAVSLDFKLSPFSNIENGNLIEFWISKKNNGTFFGGLSFENGKQVLTGGELSSGVKSSTSCSFSSGVSLRISMKLTESGIRWELKNINLDMIDCILNIGTDNSKILSNPTGYQFGIGQAFTCAQLLSNVSQIPDLIVSSMMEVCITCAKSTLSIDQQDYMPYIVGGSIGAIFLISLLVTSIAAGTYYIIRRRRRKNIVAKYVYYDNNASRQNTLEDLFEKINTNSSIDSVISSSTTDDKFLENDDGTDDLMSSGSFKYDTWV